MLDRPAGSQVVFALVLACNMCCGQSLNLASSLLTVTVSWPRCPVWRPSLQTSKKVHKFVGNCLSMSLTDYSSGDFIGSISHELRSPLHGILASAEFLAESDCNAFQMSLIDTVDSCGRTLLDTINHVLDFSKINSFERSWRQVGRGAVNSRSSSVSSAGFQGKKHLTGAPPLLNIYAVTDVAAICEEVIEGVWAGQVYSSISSSELTDVTAANRGRASDKGTVNVKNSSEAAGAQVAKKPVDIVLDVSTGNYIFTTQPGAIRRVIMNVAGNALKYTDHGLIEVVIGLRGPTETGETEGGGETFCISIKDTGKGISNHYLRTRLFTRESLS